MSPRITVLLLVMITSVFVPSQSAHSQEDQSKPEPLTVTTQYSYGAGTTCKSGTNLVVQLQYAGAQPLRGYLVRIALADPTSGKVLQQQIVEEIRDSHEAMIATGTTWTRSICLMPMTMKIKQITNSNTPDSMNVTATVDVLKFADNSIWGPAALRESHQLIGRLDGMDFISKTTELCGFVSPILPDRGPLPVQDVQSQTIGPLRIESGVWQDEHGQDMMAVAVTNQTDTPIRGYLFTTSFLDPVTGTRIRRFSTKELETHGNPSDYLAPGSTWVADPRKFSRLPDGSLASYKIALDLVVFADGSTYGPKKSPESDEVLGMIDGIDSANPKHQRTPNE
jgi:hypothetical protein